MAQDFSSLPPPIPPDDPDQIVPEQPVPEQFDSEYFDLDTDEYSNSVPSLPIVLSSAAMGLGFGIIGLYVLYGVLQIQLEISVGLATLFLFIGMGATGAGLSAATGTRAALVNVVFSCGLVALMLLFFGICMVSGAFFATLVYLLGL